MSTKTAFFVIDLVLMARAHVLPHVVLGSVAAALIRTNSSNSTALYNITMPRAFTEIISLPFRQLRTLFEQEGSDCLRSGGGKVPYFNSCVGCPIGSAQQCVLDMRRNVSFNVPPECTLGKLGASVGHSWNSDVRACCAIDGKRETYAYPDAFRCLRNVHKKCVDSHIFTELKAECESLCPNRAGVWERACFPSAFDNANSLKPSKAVLLISALSLVLAQSVHDARFLGGLFLYIV